MLENTALRCFLYSHQRLTSQKYYSKLPSFATWDVAEPLRHQRRTQAKIGKGRMKKINGTNSPFCVVFQPTALVAKANITRNLPLFLCIFLIQGDLVIAPKSGSSKTLPAQAAAKVASKHTKPIKPCQEVMCFFPITSLWNE